MPSAELADADDVGAADVEESRAAQLLWAMVDSTWVHNVDVQKFLGTFQPLRDREPESSSPRICRRPGGSPGR